MLAILIITMGTAESFLSYKLNVPSNLVKYQMPPIDFKFHVHTMNPTVYLAMPEMHICD